MIKEERKKERMKKRRRKAAGIIFLILIIVLGGGFAIGWTCFRIKTVEVEGNALYENSVIEDAVLNDKYSWNSTEIRPLFINSEIIRTETARYSTAAEHTFQQIVE